MILWARFACAFACAVASPALAGERDANAPRFILNDAVPLIPVAASVLGMDLPLGLRSVAPRAFDITVRLGAPEALPTTLVAFEALPMTRSIADIANPQLPDAVQFSLGTTRTLQDWRLTRPIQPMTSRANGWFAVGDQLADHRRPRPFRPSALTAMLVLRIDGKDDSPPLSVGGGGVAAALWGVMPRD